MSPEERAKVEQQQQRMKQGMEDLGHLTTALKPPAEDPDEPVSQLRLVIALAGAPALKQLGEDEAALLGPTLEGVKAKEALSKVC